MTVDDLYSTSFLTDPIRPTHLRIDLDALAANFSALKEKSFQGGAGKMMPVVKGNAYGHGLVACSQVLQEIGADALAVAFLEEGIALRNAGITVPILVLGALADSQIPQFLAFDLEFTAPSVLKLDQIERVAAAVGKNAKVHLKIDSGMERVGVHDYSCAPLLKRATQATHCTVVGIYSHFATAESPDLSFAQTQLSRFELVCEQFESLAGFRPLRHISSSGSILQFPEASLDLVRPGISLYGIAPSTRLASALALKPVMTLRSEVVFFKVVKAGSTVSYGQTWKAPEDTRVITVPVGYGDGYPRRLSNVGSVLVRGKKYPVVGTVCMDMCMSNIGAGEAFNGDEVVLWGTQGENQITVNEVADLVQTTPHEIVTAMNMRVPRVYVRGGKVFSELDLA